MSLKGWSHFYVYVPKEYEQTVHLAQLIASRRGLKFNRFILKLVEAEVYASLEKGAYVQRPATEQHQLEDFKIYGTSSGKRFKIVKEKE